MHLVYAYYFISSFIRPETTTDKYESALGHVSLDAVDRFVKKYYRYASSVVFHDTTQFITFYHFPLQS